ncbi:glycosyltransferase [Roseivirga sp.]|uniref:glycosyltransferase n=1 Tax=Roseivirga sp. TaxID=1964215 RepID=UPI003B8B09AC
MNKLKRGYFDNYFKRFAQRVAILDEAIHPDCNMIIVIPCHNEPDLIGTLEALLACNHQTRPVEVIIVVNEKSENDHREIHEQNLKTILEFDQWKCNLKNSLIKFRLIKALDLPHKHAGVGLARKIGMDEALRRFLSIDVDGTIVCLDADCRVSKNYLSAIEEKFGQSNANLGEVHYEHAFQHERNEGLKKGIINYELFLRYYVEGLKSAGFPYAIQTIGSCMLVKAATYAKHGGMNKRKAGEDFYFLHKIIPHEKFKEVREATVYPSCRTSDRVPFGTGKAQQDWLDQTSNVYQSYDPKIFQELKSLLDSVDLFYHNDVNEVIDRLSSIPKAFLSEYPYHEKIKLIKANCKSLDQFKKQFFVWFDGFLCMKFVHFVRDKYYPNIPIRWAIEQASFNWDRRTLALIQTVNQEA